MCPVSGLTRHLFAFDGVWPWLKFDWMYRNSGIPVPTGIIADLLPVMSASPETEIIVPGDVQETPVGAEHVNPLAEVPGVVNLQVEMLEAVFAFWPAHVV
jgi:hypothetical protein